MATPEFVDYISVRKTLTNDDLVRLERHIGVPLPPEYRLFLLTHNGGHPIPDTFTMIEDGTASEERIHSFFSLDANNSNEIMSIISIFTDRIPIEFLPIAHDPFGNLILIATTGPTTGSISFWDHEEEADEGEPLTYDNITFIAPSFDEFIADLHPSPYQ